MLVDRRYIIQIHGMTERKSNGIELWSFPASLTYVASFNSSFVLPIAFLLPDTHPPFPTHLVIQNYFPATALYARTNSLLQPPNPYFTYPSSPSSPTLRSFSVLHRFRTNVFCTSRMQPSSDSSNPSSSYSVSLYTLHSLSQPLPLWPCRKTNNSANFPSTPAHSSDTTRSYISLHCIPEGARFLINKPKVSNSHLFL